MRVFRHAFIVDADIDKVWDFYTDTGHLEIITPKQLKLKVERSTTGTKLQQWTEVWISARLVTKSAWHSRITRMEPYTYVDEMLEGRIPHWKHTHVFRKSGGGTEILDEIELGSHTARWAGCLKAMLSGSCRGSFSTENRPR